MWGYCLRRIGQMLPTVAGVVLLTFLLFNIVPNDLAAIALGKNVTPEMLESFDEQRGLNRPLFFGFRASTRAYEDQDFTAGAGRWRGEGVWVRRWSSGKQALWSRLLNSSCAVACRAWSPRRIRSW